MMKISPTLLDLALCAAILFPGCKPGSTSGGGKTLTICMLPKKKDVPYFTSCANGAEQAAKDLGNVQLV